MRISQRTSSLMRSLRLRRQRGVAAVEFALVLLPMAVIAFGAAEYGRAIYQYNTLVKSVRTSVRMLSLVNPDDGGYRTASSDTNYQFSMVYRAKCLAVYGNDACSGRALAPSLSIAHVKVCDRKDFSECAGATAQTYKDVSTGEGLIQLVAVRISGYQYPFMGLPFVTSSPTTTFADIEAVMRQLS